MKTFEPIEIATNHDIKIELRTVYVVRGDKKDYFSVKSALNKLAYVRTQEQFNEEGKESNFPYKLVKQEDGTSHLCRGDMRPEFIERHVQVLEELKANFNRERKRENEIILLRKEYQKAKEKLLKVSNDLKNAEHEYRNLK
ncbi:hypothetical protein [Xenorhabdus sp. Sc-CR9]|uniref:hypothetical protein n=1 Tax=Xenorhabdus sp. Sc-CR9 TaxID=2584468 RepID=UPI001F17762F|nr:hypothetical protein [Xenorhabdus sp. Sc-CR9]